MQELDRQFWTQRYQNGTTQWDIGYPSTPIKEFIDQLANKEVTILMPGAGNAYEVEYLWKLGFKNVFVMDISPLPIENFKKRNPDFPKDQMLLGDFFKLDKEFDLVIEQTFFCAINRDLRKTYAKKMSEIIKPGGRLVGLLFASEFEDEGPPFGGTKQEYIKYFEPYFKITQMDLAKNSIEKRMGNELWIELVRK
jgi:SAM-dependent methyltransferase